MTDASSQRSRSRAQKRAQFQGAGRRRRLPVILAVAVVAVAAIVAGFVVLGRGASGADVVAVQNGKVVLPAAQFTYGTARFYAYDANGTRVKFFAVADAKGKVHVALDACEVCYPKKLGYKQGGQFMQCNNCGKKFRTDRLDQETGGCNPVPVQSDGAAGNVVISAGDLDAGVKYFQ